MATVKSEEKVPQNVDVDDEINKVKLNSETKNTKKNKKNNKKLSFPKFGCFRIQHDATGEGGYDIEVVDASGHSSYPTHLIIMVNGLIGR
jgi:hypothetical protein